jgi:hypothetical protein
MLPVHRSNLPLANKCLNHLLQNCDYNIIVIDENGNDEEYIKNERITFIHNDVSTRQPLVKIWNNCIKNCPTDNIIIASWRQRPQKQHFNIIEEKLSEGFGLVAFDGLHFFAFNKYLTNVIGMFDEGFSKGQFEDTDWWNRLMTNNIAIYTGDMEEERMFNGTYVQSTWLEGSEVNKQYYESKWKEDVENNRLILFKEEQNFSDRLYFKNCKKLSFKTWENSILTENLKNYFSIFKFTKKV